MIFGIPFIIALIFPALALSGLNYWYWSKKGYSSAGTFIMGLIGIYGMLYYILKAFV
jgi:hypothetical protein